MSRPCGVVDSNFCTAPANSDVSTSGTCFACGQPVCKGCSLKVKWFSYGKQRIGFDCLREEGRGAEVEAAYAAMTR